jgi:SpoVK/Ycf46/Vps4 family AAA+-type ATPase
VIVFMDEIEKWASGIMATGGDNGVNKDAFGVVLKEIALNKYRGLTIVGPAGTGKTVFAQATAAEFGVPLLEVDMGEAKGSLMGESQAKVRQLWKTIAAIAGEGGALIICAANSLPDDLPQELRRRIASLGTYFADLPTPDERSAIWSIHRSNYGISPAFELPNDDDWTGADIANCCDLADSLGLSLVDASKRLVPMAKSQPDTIKKLRQQANGRWQSSTIVGPYVMTDPDAAAREFAGARRTLKIGDN